MYPGIAGCGLHDPLGVAQNPSLAKGAYVRRGALARGQTIADRRRTLFRRSADVRMNLDSQRFEANFLAALKRP